MTKFLQDLLFSGELTVSGAVTLNSTLEVNSTGFIRNGLTISDYGGVNTTYSLLALTGTNSQTFGVKNGATYVSGSIGVFDNYSQPFYFYTNRGFNFIPANSRSSSTVDWIYAGGTMFVAGGNPNQSNGWVSIKPTFNYNGLPDTGTKYIGFYYSPTNYSDLGSQHYAIVADAGKVEFGDLSGTNTRMVTASSSGILGTTALPEALIINNNADYRVITGSTTPNTLNANAKLLFYDFAGSLYLESEPSWGYGAGIEFINTNINGTQWGFYGGSTSDTGFMLYRYLPVQVELAYWNTDRYAVRNDVKIGWSSTNLSFGAIDIAFVRESAGVVQINNGTTNVYASLKLAALTASGDINAANVVASAYVIANTMWVSGSYKNNNNGNMSLAFSGSTLQLTTDYGVSLSASNIGQITIPTLTGTGNRMVVANDSGVLSTQSLPTTITNYVTTDTTQTITGQKTFKTLTTIFDSNNSSTFIEGRASGVLYGGISFGLFMQYNAYPAATQGYLWKNGIGSNVMALTQAGELNLAVLAGTGTRMVVADTNGNLSVQAVPTGSLQEAVDADKNTSGSLPIGTTIIKSVSASTYSGVFFDYVVKNGTNVRVGSVVAITNGTTVESYETLSNDIGTTTALTFTVTLSSGNMNLNAVANTTGWTVIVSTRAL